MNDDREALIDQALPLEPGNEFDLDIPPASGTEYLKRVHLEAKKCPDIVVANVDKSKFKAQTVNVSSSNGCQPCPSGFSPPMSWQRAVVADFSETRQSLVKLKLSRAFKNAKSPVTLADANDAEGWCRLCFGKMMVHREKVAFEKRVKSEMDGSDDDDDDDGGSEDRRATFGDVECSPISYHEPTPPFLSIVLRMDQSLLEKVLHYHVQWFEATGFSKNQGQWFYALLACLEKPLTPEACSLLRRLARSCCNLRATLDSPDHAFASQLNLLICLVGRYFGQSDMADR